MKFSKHNHPTARRGITLVEILVILAVIAILGLLIIPNNIGRGSGRGHQITATTNNAKQVGTFLYLFRNDYGTFPTHETSAKLATEGIAVKPGASSNAYLSQLIASDYTNSEEIFYAEGSGTIKPDSVINTITAMLDQGECGFSYVMLAGGIAIPNDPHSQLPILCAPMKAGATGTSGVFDPDPYDGKAVYLRQDQSVQQKRIDKNHDVVIGGGKTLFQTGPDTAWGDKIPLLAFPDRR